MLAIANLRLHKVVSNSSGRHGGNSSRGSCQKHQGSRSAPRRLTSTTFAWGPLGHREGSLHLPSEKPFTRRGVLSTIYSVYDLLGLASPVVLEGKLILQQLVVTERRQATTTPWLGRLAPGDYEPMLASLERCFS